MASSREGWLPRTKPVRVWVCGETATCSTATQLRRSCLAGRRMAESIEYHERTRITWHERDEDRVASDVDRRGRALRAGNSAQQTRPNPSRAGLAPRRRAVEWNLLGLQCLLGCLQWHQQIHRGDGRVSHSHRKRLPVRGHRGLLAASGPSLLNCRSRNLTTYEAIWRGSVCSLWAW